MQPKVAWRPVGVLLEYVVVSDFVCEQWTQIVVGVSTQLICVFSGYKYILLPRTQLVLRSMIHSPFILRGRRQPQVDRSIQADQGLFPIRFRTVPYWNRQNISDLKNITKFAIFLGRCWHWNEKNVEDTCYVQTRMIRVMCKHVCLGP